MRDDPRVVALVTRASGGDQDAWNELVDRYRAFVYTICTGYRLSNHDIEDVGQNVWLLLVEQLGKLREPAALPGWLATTTARECLRVVTAASKTERLGTWLDDSVLFADDVVIEEEVLVADRNAALRVALPQRPRCLERLRRSDVLAALGEGDEKINIREASQVRDWDDDRLLAALGQALKDREAVPSWFIETGKSAFAWHNIDAELAQLTYDSHQDQYAVAMLRSETASIRALTFTSAHMSLELEVTGNSLLGQLLPPRAGELEIHTRTGGISTTEVDEIGCFSVDPIPDSPFRLRCRTADGTDVLTGWITI